MENKNIEKGSITQGVNNKEENKIGGRKYWHPAEEIDKQQENFQPEVEAEKRVKALEDAINTIRERLTDAEREKIKAIILFGSTARGMVMHPDADIDLHIDLETHDADLLKKIKEIVREKISNIDVDFTEKSIKKEGRTAKLLTAQKYPDKPATWKFLYSRNEQKESELNAILLESSQREK